MVMIAFVGLATFDKHGMGATSILQSGIWVSPKRKFGELDRLVEPDALAPLLLLVVGVLSIPMSLLLEVNAYYLGMLPVLSEVAQQAGIPPEAMAEASPVGMYTVGFPLTPLTHSFFLLVGLAGVNIGAHIRHMLPWACLVSIVMLISAIILAQIPFPT